MTMYEMPIKRNYQSSKFCPPALQLPRAFVNLVQIIDVTRLAPLKGGLLCTIVHRCGCPCCLDDSGDTSDASAFYQVLYMTA